VRQCTVWGTQFWVVLGRWMNGPSGRRTWSRVRLTASRGRQRGQVSGSRVWCFVHGRYSGVILLQFESPSDSVVHVGCPVDMVLVASSTAFQHNFSAAINCSHVLCLFVFFSVHVNRAGDTGSDGLQGHPGK